MLTWQHYLEHAVLVGILYICPQPPHAGPHVRMAQAVSHAHMRPSSHGGTSSTLCLSASQWKLRVEPQATVTTCWVMNSNQGCVRTPAGWGPGGGGAQQCMPRIRGGGGGDVGCGLTGAATWSTTAGGGWACSRVVGMQSQPAKPATNSIHRGVARGPKKVGPRPWSEGDRWSGVHGHWLFSEHPARRTAMRAATTAGAC